MEQAGIYRVNLYETKNLILGYPELDNSNKIIGIQTDGDIINLENEQRIKFNFNPKINKNYKTSYDFELNFYQFDLTIDNILLIEQLMGSIYGWSALLIFYNYTAKFIKAPLFLEEAPINTNESHHFDLVLKNRVPSNQRLLDYEGEIVEYYLLIDADDYLDIGGGDKVLIN